MHEITIAKVGGKVVETPESLNALLSDFVLLPRTKNIGARRRKVGHQNC